MKEVTLENFHAECLSLERAIVYFYQEHCVGCVEMQPEFEQIANELGWVVCKVDINKFPELGSKYKIQSTPTTVFLMNGVEYNRRAGICKKECLVESYSLEKGKGKAIKTTYNSIIFEGNTLIEFIQPHPNCSNCNNMKPKVEEFAKNHPDIKVYVVEANQVLAQKFKMTTMPLIVAFVDEKEIKRANAMVDMEKTFGPTNANENVPINQVPMEKLKAFAYDKLRQINVAQQSLREIETEIMRRENGAQ